jgi:hypothetical protein
MTFKTPITNTSSLAALALILTALLTACPDTGKGGVGDLSLCQGTSKNTEVGVEGAIIQAEDYLTATTGIERRQPSGGPCALRTTSSDSSGEYSLNISQASDFDVLFNLNANAGAKLRLELDGNPLETNLNVTATGTAFKEFTIPVLTLPAGEHALRLVVADLNGSSAVMIDSFRLKKPATNVPYSGTLPAVPAAAEKLTLEAEQFDRGGTLLAYSDTTPGNSGAGSRISNVDVDIKNNDQFVTDTQPGEYLKYSFTVPAAPAGKTFTYKVGVRYAAQGGGKFSLSMGGRKLIDKASVLSSGGETNWRTETFTVGGISAGPHEFVFYFDSNTNGTGNGPSIMNVDRLEVAIDTDVAPYNPPATPNGVIGEVSAVYEWPLMPIHAALMPNGKVFAWGGGDNYNGGGETLVMTPDPAQQGDGARSKMYFPITTLFCSGFSHLPDGRLLIAGGHWDNFVGVPDANIFDHNSQTISPTSSMNADQLPNAVGNPKGDKTFDSTLYYKDPKHVGRWYPSATSLANGEILVSEGYSSILNVTNNLPEVWKSNNGGGWRELDNAQVTTPGALSYYPFMYPRPNGEVIRVGPEATMYAFRTDGAGAVRKLNTRPDGTNRDYGSAVMFAPGKILIVGGNGGDGSGIDPLKTGAVINIKDSDYPGVSATGNMKFGRRHLSTTVLPTGEVLVSAGSSKMGHNAAPYETPMEVYNPGTNSFRTVTNLNVGRGYHSIALLLPDGRIMIGGGGNCGGCQTNGEQNNVEYYKPPYLFKPNGNGGQTPVTSRPEITSTTGTEFGYGQNFQMNTSGKSIARVTMIKLGAVTHARNFDQNFNELFFTSNGSNLTVTTPSEPAWATPGHYMLFAIDTDGVPSVAKIIKLQ